MPKVGGDSPVWGVWREEEAPKARRQKGKGFGIRLIWFWPPTLLLACSKPLPETGDLGCVTYPL